ncbi:PREDICTED: protein TIME FOR COFFEE-like isoform X3 [Lupinus angustifolius]|uniref:protein TIME FOR COFFEE-like isoform X3 n=1 Tax=Lupinus angustifolius TaxID=3871 RepID=UPI00092FC560|nr:PREDICTED: protein TIME FOR COFFEE-like isoform X3 [Lupinus angustifolius]
MTNKSMERNRESRERRTLTMSDGLTRRRHRTSNTHTTHSPEEYGETTRLRDRVNMKKDRLGRSKGRRAREEDVGEYTSDESFNDEDEDHNNNNRRIPPPPPPPPPSSKVFRTPSWKPADEMIGVSVPRKARSAITKRSSHDSSGGIMAEQIHPHPFTSSSNLSVRKKIVPLTSNNNNNNNNNNGHKIKFLKSSQSSSSSSFKAPCSSSAEHQEEEIEIEIAQVLYGMMTQPHPSPLNKSCNTHGKSESLQPQNSTSHIIPMSVLAPKRKRPRQVNYDEESQSPASFTIRRSPISSSAKVESDHPSKVETCSQNFDDNTEPVPGNAAVSCDLANSQGGVTSSEAQPESIKVESYDSSHSKPPTEESAKKDVELSNEVVAPQAPNKESPVVKSMKSNFTPSKLENQREQKFQIDLMAPPPLLRSSPERDSQINFVAGDPKALVTDAEMEVMHTLKEDDTSLRTNKEEAVAVEMDEVESQKPIIMQKESSTNLQLDLEKGDKADTSGSDNIVMKKQHQNNIQKLQQQPSSEKNDVSNSVPLTVSVPNWPGGLPPMGRYMTSLPGVVSMGGSAVTSAAITPSHLLFNQPRPKRCATHCYIARNILYHQQISKMNPFWPTAAGSASLYGAKPCNLNVVPSTELHANVPNRPPNPTQDKDNVHVMFPGHMSNDKGSQPIIVDNSQRKQVLLQQALPPGTPSNILGPAFIFPLNQQHAAAAAAAASIRPGSMNSSPIASSGIASFTSNAVSQNASATGTSAVPPMSFSYPNIAGNETQYLAILQNNAYPFPIPAHIGGPPTYRGTHAQAVPFFNGSFYSSQMLHPSQIQQQPQPQQTQQGRHASISSGSSPSQKHVQNQQQKPNVSGSNGGVGVSGGSMQGSPVTKNHSSQPLQLQQQQQPKQQAQNHHTTHPAHQIDSEMGSADSPSADSRLTRATMSIYGQNFAMPVQTPNFAFMTPASLSGTGSNGSRGEKKQAQQHPGPKAAAETSQAFAMSFASINGATPASGLELSPIAQSHHSIMQNHHNYQIMTAAQAASAQQKKKYCVLEEEKHVVDSSNLDVDKKPVGGKFPATVGQSIAFSRPDASDPSITTLTGNNVVDSSARTLSLGSASINTISASSQQHMQRNQQQIIQLQKQNQYAAAAVATAQSKTPSTNNGSVYSDHLPSTLSMATKFPNAVSMFPQNLVQSSSTAVAQSPQWKNSSRATASQFPSPMASTPSSSVKTLPQQQSRSQQAHSQISFSANPKSTSVQVQPLSSTQYPSPPVIIGSPTSSSVSKNTGSPRTTSTSTDNKITQTSLASQQTKNSQTGPSGKSGRNSPSILSGPQLTSSTGAKLQLPQQQQQQISKQTLPRTQLLMSNPYYVHSQVSQSNSSTPTTSAASGYYLQRRGGGHDQMQRQSSSGTNSNGAAPSNTKGSGLPPSVLPHPAQFATMSQSGNHHQFVVPAAFPYVHAVPATVQVKQAEQKQPAGE